MSEGIHSLGDHDIDRLAAAMALGSWDRHVITDETAAVQNPDPEVRRVFQAALLANDTGRRCLAHINVMGYMMDAEIATERERHVRNFVAKINALCGLTSKSVELMQLMLEYLAPIVMRAEQIHEANQEQEGKR